MTKESDTSHVTRRDFVGGTLIGTGTALLSAASPGAIRSAAAQTVKSPMAGLDESWTGPGGVGDYAASNGNTHQVVNDAHIAVRNHDYDRALRAAIDTGESVDAIIIGCGIAGLSAAWTLRLGKPDATVLMLDSHPIFGGEAKQNELDVDGYHLTAPQGATGLVVPFDRAKVAGFSSHFAEDLGFPNSFEYQKPTGLSRELLVPEDAWTPMHIGWERSDTGFFYREKGWVRNPWHDGFKHAPIPEHAKRALVDLDMYRTPPRRDDWDRWLDTMTYQEFLTNVVGVSGESLPYITQYLNPVTAAMGCGLGADVISAYSALNFLQPGVIGYVRQSLDGLDPTDSMYLASFPGGHAGTARHFLKKVMPAAIEGEYRMADILNGRVRWDQLDKANEPVRMRLSSTVVAVQHDGPVESARSATVIYLKGGKLYKARARAVIICSPQHVNRHICRDVSADYRQAMNEFHHAPMLVVNVAVRHWRFLEKLGIASARWFDGFGWWLSLRRNLEIPGQQTQPLDPSKPVVLTMYNPFCLPGVPFPQQCTAARLQLFAQSYAAIEAAVREQLTLMFGDHGFEADRDIAGIITNRWGHAYVVDPPGFFFGKNGRPAAKDVLQQRFHRLSFGHSELTGAQMWETAAGEGERASKQALEII